MRYLYIFLFSLLLFSCKNNSNSVSYQQPQVQDGNIFEDDILKEIYTLKDERNTVELLPYLKEEIPHYREIAALSFASIQDTAAIDALVALFRDKNTEVRLAAAFSLGQMKSSRVAPLLLHAFRQEKTSVVKQYILESIGKTGTQADLNHISNFDFDNSDLSLLRGQAWALARFAVRDISSPTATKRVFAILNSTTIPEKIKVIASYYLARTEKLNLQNHFADMKTAFLSGGFIYTRINLAIAFGKVSTEESKLFLLNILNSDYDYRIKINTIKSLQSFDYQEVKNILFQQLRAPNPNLAIQASSYFIKMGNSRDAEKYISEAEEISNWRARSNLFAAAMKYGKSPTTATLIKKYYENSNDAYEKAALLAALKYDIHSHKFVAFETFSTKNRVVATYGIEALVHMRRDNDFEKFNANSIKKGTGNIEEEFSLMFKQAINTGDVSMIGVVAALLRDPKLNFHTFYKNTYFLTQALHRCKLPQDLEAYMELQKTISYINGSPEVEYSPPNDKLIDWELVTSIAPDQTVTIKTTKGEFTVQLSVNTTPATVANFIRLVKDKFYNGLIIHRVVPNFVVQSGCVRGDGWGGLPHTIRSEFPLERYTEGSIGMASAGKDTESSQWFICHSPVPHLDGRYTVFGTVTAGMDNVHQLEVGDTILKIEID